MPMTWPNSPTVGQLHQPNGATGPTYVFLGSKVWKSLGFGVGGNAFSVVLTGGQTVINALYQVGAVAVYRSGSRQRDTDDYVATNGTTITLVDPGVAGEVVTVVANSILSSLDPSVRRRPVAAKTAAYLVTLADLGSTIFASGTWTLSLPAAAAAGNGFIVLLKNIGTGVITIDPNGSETVDGFTTIGAYQRDSVELVCDGTGWQAMFANNIAIIAATTLAGISSAQPTIDLPLPAEFMRFELEMSGASPVAASASLGARFSLDGGATYLSTGYAWYGEYVSSGTVTNPSIYTSGASIFGTSGVELSPGSVTTAQTHQIDFMEIEPGRAGNLCPTLKNTHASGNAAFQLAGGYYAAFGRATHIRLLQNTGNIAAGARYTLTGKRAAA